MVDQGQGRNQDAHVVEWEDVTWSRRMLGIGDDGEWEEELSVEEIDMVTGATERGYRYDDEGGC